jgi:hypothetical protein
MFACCVLTRSDAGLQPLVEWNTRRELDTRVSELQVRARGPGACCGVLWRAVLPCDVCGCDVLCCLLTCLLCSAVVLYAVLNFDVHAVPCCVVPSWAALSSCVSQPCCAVPCCAVPCCAVVPLQDGLSTMMTADPPHSAAEITSYIKQRKTEQVRC